ncbi:MAG: dihydrodipicolinate synthase family protein, partial [Candidatus Hydrogenedentes bacterium]|nr:dihydrodipicolinate synthase family protein [Candidatus Hydrogenedentota bacterium]
MTLPMLPRAIRSQLNEGVAIPAHPLALTKNGKFDDRHQRALTRYYCDAGAGGIAVAVHTTQFAIREPRHGLFGPVIELASETVAEWERKRRRTIIRVGGVCGATAQAVREAELLREAGYHVALLSLSALRDATLDATIAHCRAVAEVMPLMGFYLQPAVGGRVLPLAFWRQFAAIENVAAIKVAPFNRYQTFDVVRALVEAERERDIVLYTGNDDHIVLDLLCDYSVRRKGRTVSVGFVGGLLGHWACWTKKAAELLVECKETRKQGRGVPRELAVRANEVTDMNAALFDAANGFHGCIAGIHEVLYRQGLLASPR